MKNGVSWWLTVEATKMAMTSVEEDRPLAGAHRPARQFARLGHAAPAAASRASRQRPVVPADRPQAARQRAGRQADGSGQPGAASTC